MEDVGRNASNITDDGYENDKSSTQNEFITHVVTYVILCIGLPLTLVAIRALYSLVRNDHVAPIFIINLLLSDILQLCFMITEVTETKIQMVNSAYNFFYHYGLIASVGFMVCVALERYLLIAWPLWYRYRRTIKFSVMVCVVVWVLPLVFLVPQWLFSFDTSFILSIFFLLPFPLLIFFLVGTLRALSAAISVSSAEKRRIVAVLVTVLLIYTLLFLPGIICLLTEEDDPVLTQVTFSFLKISPLADLFLYVFIKKGVVDRLLASVCCCRMDRDEDNRPAETEMTT